MIGEFDTKLKTEIDSIQIYIDWLLERGMDDFVPRWRSYKQELIDEIKEV